MQDGCLVAPVIAVLAGLTSFFLFLKLITHQYIYPLSNPPNRWAFDARFVHKEEMSKSHRDGAEATCTRCVLGSSLDNVSQKKLKPQACSFGPERRKPPSTSLSSYNLLPGSEPSTAGA